MLTPTARCVRNYKLRLRFTHLGKGDAALSRCIPLAADTSITPSRPRSALQIAAGWNVSAQRMAVASPVGERSCSPTPHDRGRLRSPLEPIDQPSAGWMPSGLSRPEPRYEASCLSIPARRLNETQSYDPLLFSIAIAPNCSTSRVVSVIEHQSALQIEQGEHMATSCLATIFREPSLRGPRPFPRVLPQGCLPIDPDSLADRLWNGHGPNSMIGP